MKNRVVVGLLLWLTAVCTVAGLAWFAIDSAGKSVTALPISPSGVSDQIEPEPDPTASVDASSTPATAPPPSSQPTGVSTGALSVSTEPTAGATSSSGSSSPSASRTSSPTRSSSRPTSKPTPPPTPKLLQATKSSEWGSVTIGCRAGRVSLQNAAPGPDRWQMDVRSSGPPQVEVVFSRKGTQVKVEGVCAGGNPGISVKTDD